MYWPPLVTLFWVLGCLSCFPFWCWIFGVFLHLYWSEFLFLFGLFLHMLWHLRKVPSQHIWQIPHEHEDLDQFCTLLEKTPFSGMDFDIMVDSVVSGCWCSEDTLSTSQKPSCKVWFQSDSVWIKFEILKKIPADLFMPDLSGLHTIYVRYFWLLNFEKIFLKSFLLLAPTSC